MDARYLEGKVCLVSGSSRSLGADIVRALAARGADVAVGYCGYYRRNYQNDE